jgi:hypothetical protein
MTVSNQEIRTSVIGNGTTQDIPFLFPANATSDISVIGRLISTGDESDPALIENSDYTVVLNGDDGGTVTMITTFSSLYQIHVVRDTPNTQLLDLEQGGAWNAENAEDAWDKNTKLNMENAEILGNTGLSPRVLRFPKTDPTSSLAEMPNSVDRKSKNLSFDSDGKPTASVVVETGQVNFTAIGTNIAEAADAETVRGLIELDTDDDVEFAAITGTTGTFSGAVSATTGTFSGAVSGTTFTMTDLITKGPYHDVRAYGPVGTSDDTAVIQAAIDACETGGIVFLPVGTYRVANLYINKPMTFVGTGYGTKLVAVAAATGYLLTVDGTITTTDPVTRDSEGLDGGVSTFLVQVGNMWMEGDGRLASIGGISLKRADWGNYFDMQIHNFQREAINCIGALRESRFVNIKTRWCGSDTTYPTLNLNDTEAGINEAHNNLTFDNIELVYSLGDIVQLDTVVKPTGLKVRNIRFVNSMFHGILASLDGNDNNPFNITFSTAQKQFTMMEIGAAEFISVENCQFVSLGEQKPGVNILGTAGGDPTLIRFVNNKMSGRYDSSATAADIGIHLQTNELVLTGNTIQTTDGSSVPLQTESGTSVYYGTNTLVGGTPIVAGGVFKGKLGGAVIQHEATGFKNVSGITIGSINDPSGFGSDIVLNGTGIVALTELTAATTPTATPNYGKLYTKDNNNLYFQDGAGVEHTVTIS